MKWSKGVVMGLAMGVLCFGCATKQSTQKASRVRTASVKVNTTKNVVKPQTETTTTDTQVEVETSEENSDFFQAYRQLQAQRKNILDLRMAWELIEKVRATCANSTLEIQLFAEAELKVLELHLELIEIGLRRDSEDGVCLKHGGASDSTRSMCDDCRYIKTFRETSEQWHSETDAILAEKSEYEGGTLEGVDLLYRHIDAYKERIDELEKRFGYYFLPEQ